MLRWQQAITAPSVSSGSQLHPPQGTQRPQPLSPKREALPCSRYFGRHAHRPSILGSPCVHTALPAAWVSVSNWRAPCTEPLPPPGRARATGVISVGLGSPHSPRPAGSSLKAGSVTKFSRGPRNHPAHGQGWDKMTTPRGKARIKDPASRKPPWLCPGPAGCRDCGPCEARPHPSPRPTCPWSGRSCRHSSPGDPLRACGGGGRGRHGAAQLPGQEQSSHSAPALVPGPRGLLSPPRG